MSGRNTIQAYQISAGTSADIGATVSEAKIAIPDNAVGDAKFVVVSVESIGADATCYIAFGDSSVTAAVGTDHMVNENTTGCVYNVSGCTHMSAITGSGVVIVNLTPLENQ